MPAPRLEDVFKLSGVPTYTFVKPNEYNKLLIALRTAGRGVVIEGPSGIGKTTAVMRALQELGLDKKALRLSARKADDVSLIKVLPQTPDAGLVIIDDFHRLPVGVRQEIGDYLKTLADEERADTKLVLIGINKTGEALIAFARDLGYRIDTIPFEANPEEKVEQLVCQGEDALKISIESRNDIVEASHGSFYIAQMLCHEMCLAASVMEAQTEQTPIEVSFETIRLRVMNNLSAKFLDIAIRFASGTKLRREGRAPYLHILKWIADANEWSIFLDREITSRPEQRASVSQVVEKGYLKSFIENDGEFGSVIHFDADTHILTIEDPQFVFFLRNLQWNYFAQQVGFVNIDFPSSYDFALSFAGVDRGIAKRLCELLEEHEIAVFYDHNEQHRILAENIEEYLGPIYRTEAAFVICLLGPEYPKRIWTKFESDQFRERFGKGTVIPIWFTTTPPGMFDESTRVGGVTFDPEGDVEDQIQQIAGLLRRKLLASRNSLI